MADQDDAAPEVLFRSVSRKGKGVIRKCAGSDELWQIRCAYVDPDWSEPLSLDFIRKHYCYEGAKCVIDLAAASQKRSTEAQPVSSDGLACRSKRRFARRPRALA